MTAPTSNLMLDFLEAVAMRGHSVIIFKSIFSPPITVRVHHTDSDYTDYRGETLSVAIARAMEVVR